MLIKLEHSDRCCKMLKGQNSQGLSQALHRNKIADAQSKTQHYPSASLGDSGLSDLHLSELGFLHLKKMHRSKGCFFF